MKSWSKRYAAALAVMLLAGMLWAYCRAGAKATATFPDPATDDSLAATAGQKTAVLAGGCFWGTQLVFEHVKGVVEVSAGYSGGASISAHYEMVSSGDTGHAESVRIKFDSSQVTYGQILKVFFAVAHDPTELNRQGPDEGSQYRSVIFYADADQQRIAQAYIKQLNQAGTYPHPIVTEVVPLVAFYPAETLHQDFATRNPDNPYIAVNDMPKLAQLRKRLPELYVKKR